MNPNRMYIIYTLNNLTLEHIEHGKRLYLDDAITLRDEIRASKKYPHWNDTNIAEYHCGAYVGTV